jgi:hypothetical protein
VAIGNHHVKNEIISEIQLKYTHGILGILIEHAEEICTWTANEHALI